jgi:hypothetical protein
MNDKPNPLERWNDGIVEKWVRKKFFFLVLSNIPLFQSSIIPKLLYSLFIVHGSIFLARTSLGLTPSEGPTTPSSSIFSTMRAARL